MPRLYRKSKKRSNGGNESVVDCLLTGNCIDCLLHEVDHSGDALRPEWEKLRDILLPEFVRAHPGERPWAWWAFDAPGRRERVDGKLHPFDDPDRKLHVAKSDNKEFWKAAYRLTWGYPAAFIMPFDAYLKAENYEQTWEYLVRNNLLTPEDTPFDTEAKK